MPPWIEHEQPISLDTGPTAELSELSGDKVAQEYHQQWAAGKKYPLITFPSQISRELIPQPEPQVHVFGALDLPYHSTRDEAYLAAEAVKDDFSVPFYVSRAGEDTLILVNSLSKQGYHLTYDNDQRRMIEIVRFPDEEMELLPDELRAVLPPIYANEKIGDNAYAPVKFFTPAGGWTWYATEFDGDDALFGLVSGLEIELGYFSLTELESVRAPLGLAIERDLYYNPKTLKEIMAYERKIRGA